MLAGAQGSCRGSAVLVNLTAHTPYDMMNPAAALHNITSDCWTAGCWLLAAASKGVILEQGLHNRAMWHHVLELMGGDHELLSEWVKKQYPKDMLETILRNDESP